MEQIVKDRIRNRDGKYANKIGRFRFIRDLFLFISIPIFIGSVAIYFHYGGHNSNFDSGGFIFCLLIAYAAHIRVQHIETINYCKELESQVLGQNTLNSKATENT